MSPSFRRLPTLSRLAFSPCRWPQHLAELAPEPYAFINQTASALLIKEGSDGAASSGILSVHQFLFGALAIATALYVSSRIFGRYKPYYSKRELSNLQRTRDFVMGELLDKKASLYKLYFDQTISDLQ